MPHVYASQIEYMSKHLARRDSVIVSVHPHNDCGTGVAAAELAMLAGAERLEGTLFGNGERTGNVDIVTLCAEPRLDGIDPGLDFSNLPAIQARVEALTKMQVSKRHPYAGELVFMAFGIASGRDREGHEVARGKVARALDRALSAHRSQGHRARIRGRSSVSTASLARAALAMCWSSRTASICLRRCASSSATRSSACRTGSRRSCRRTRSRKSSCASL